MSNITMVWLAMMVTADVLMTMMKLLLLIMMLKMTTPRHTQPHQ